MDAFGALMAADGDVLAAGRIIKAAAFQPAVPPPSNAWADDCAGDECDGDLAYLANCDDPIIVSSGSSGGAVAAPGGCLDMDSTLGKATQEMSQARLYDELGELGGMASHGQLDPPSEPYDWMMAR